MNLLVQSGIAVAVTGISGATAMYVWHRKRKQIKNNKKKNTTKTNKGELVMSFHYRQAFRIQKFDDSIICQLIREPILEKEAQISGDFGECQKLFRCPISNRFLSDAVVLNGFIYDRAALEDWIFENNWEDPVQIGSARNEPTLVSPDDILEPSAEFKERYATFASKFEKQMKEEDSDDDANSQNDHFIDTF